MALEDTLPPGSRVGRHVIASLLGAGGMGVVYAAHDPELDRRVAIKLLRPDRAAHQRRLLSEAHALAQLSHPNVVAIHDVGVHAGRVWLAMEFVRGRTFSGYLREAPRSWRDVVSIVCAVGRGLAAAHAIGLLHRDIKPDNVMIDHEGRVRLMDFGLARAELEPAAQPEPSGTPERLRLTQTGTVMGTPAYMAPEQRLGLDVDARADQFSLCVMLWEALHGERPYVPCEDGRPMPLVWRSGARKRGVPRWLRRVCTKGLQLDPDARFDSVAALVEQLEQGQTRRRRRIALGSACGAALALALVLGARELDTAEQVAACEAAAGRLERGWDAAARTQLHDSIRALEIPDAEPIAARTLDTLDTFAGQWRRAKLDTCLASHDDAAAELAALADDCLDERAGEFELVHAALLAADDIRIHQLIRTASRLRLDACHSEQQLRGLPRAPLDLRIRIPALREQLFRATLLQQRGELPAALALARASAVEAGELGWDPLTARAEGLIGRLLLRSGDYAGAEQTLEAAYLRADASGAFDVRVTVAGDLAHVVGYQLARPDEGLRWSRLAEAGLLAWGSDDPLARASMLGDRGLIEYGRGRSREAVRLYEQALALETDAFGPHHPYLYGSLNRLGAAYDAEGRPSEARVLYERALELAGSALGPGHPDLAAILTNLALVEQVLGSASEARRLHERALAIRRAALGDDHPEVADSLLNLAAALRELGELDAARAALQAALPIYERSFGQDHPDVALTLVALAELLELRGETLAAGDLFADALARFTAHGPRPEALRALSGLARIAAAQGRSERVVELLLDAATLLDSLGPIDSIDVRPTLLDLAALARRSGRADLAARLAPA